MLADLPLEERFDLVVVNFVLHWVDRSTLARSISEIDRVVTDGGHLILGDFLPDSPLRRSYRHRKDERVYTYKQDYARIFEALCTYKELARMTYDHDKPNLGIGSADSCSRGVCVLLGKSETRYYHTEETTP